jgi:hypothetical protein
MSDHAGTVDSPSLLLRLQALRQQLAASLRHHTAQRDALRRADRAAALRAAADAEQHVRALVVTTERLRARVVPVDGLGDGVASLSELVLRAVRLVVLAELCTVGRLVNESSVDAGLVASVQAELNEITEQWRRCRGAAVDRERYRSALRKARAAMRNLGATSAFARWLDDGLHRVARPVLRTACARALSALTISIDVEPDMPVLVVHWPRWGALERPS